MYNFLLMFSLSTTLLPHTYTKMQDPIYSMSTNSHLFSRNMSHQNYIYSMHSPISPTSSLFTFKLQISQILPSTNPPQHTTINHSSIHSSLIYNFLILKSFLFFKILIIISFNKIALKYPKILILKFKKTL